MKILKRTRIVSVVLILALVWAFCASYAAAEGLTLTYTFSGTDKNTAGYAEGTLTLNNAGDANYKLYWADGSGALAGYYPIASDTFKKGGSKRFTFDKHTTIPAGATRIVALNDSNSQVAQYVLPEKKRLNAGKLLYTFNSYSDIHIDKDANGVYYKKASKRWSDALKYGVKMKTDFIVTSGDTVTNATGPDAEWEEYERLLANSDYVNPVWESDGNHDMRSDDPSSSESSGLKAFIRATGTDSTAANYDAKKPYYYMIEKNSGDVFIFMALEGNTKSKANESSQFSDAQLNWLEKLIKKYYNTGVNVYIIEHSPINGFGAGDRMSNPYYKGHIRESFDSTKRFKKVLLDYPGLIFMSGHSHEDFSMGYNYSNENNTACNMIHNPAVAGTTKAKEGSNSLEYYNDDGEVGYNSQGYYVEVFDNEVVFYGADLTDGLIFPEYSYIMEGSRTPVKTQPETEATSAPDMTEATSSTARPTDTTAPTETTEETSTATETQTTQPATEAYEKGDVNLDGAVNIRDTTTIQRALAKLLTISDYQRKLADTDNDGNVTIKDATKIQKFLAALISSLDEPDEEKDSQKAVKEPKSPAKTAKKLTGDSDLTSKLTKVRQKLAGYYSFASYDQYQALKKLYKENESKTSADSALIDDFNKKLSDLEAIVTHVGKPEVYDIGDTYFFENTYDWSAVYAYAWKGDKHNVSWPGAKLKKVGTNSGHDVYAIRFASAAEYDSLIFSNGTNTGQTVDISLVKYGKNCFYIKGEGSDGKLKVGNFSFNTDVNLPVTETEPEGSNNSFALYYHTDNHKWNYDSGVRFNDNADGTYTYEYYHSDTGNLSFCIYNPKTKTYSCVSDSQSLTFSSGGSEQYTLVDSSERGKSVTVYGISEGDCIEMTYDPVEKTLNLECK